MYGRGGHHGRRGGGGGGGYNANVPSILSTKKKEIPRLMMIYQKKSQFQKHRSAVRRGEDRAVVTWWYL